MEFDVKELNFKYEAYGLKIHSEMSLPELMSVESDIADITIVWGKFELPQDQVLSDGFSYKVTKEAIYRFWDDIGKFKITNKSIIIDTNLSADELILRTYILGTVLATLLRLRGLFILHASCVNLNGNAVCFSGFKGYGKSTTAMAFYKEGYHIVADDYVLIKVAADDIYFTYPGFPNLRLSFKSRELMGLNSEVSTLNSGKVDKTYVSAPASFSTNKLPLKKIYILRRGKRSGILDLKTQEAFLELVKNTFGIHMFSKLELPNNFFECEKIVNNVNIAILEIPDGIESLSNIIKKVEEDLGT